MANKRPRTASEPAPAADDFKLINSISGKMESRLQRAGITSYAELAELAPSEIAGKLGNPAGLLERIIRENWSGQARELAEFGNRSDDSADKSAESTSNQHYETFAAELVLNSDRQVLNTRLMHVPSGEEARWEGWDEQRLLSFFAQRSGLQLSGTVESAAEPAPVSAETVLAKAEDVHAKTSTAAPQSEPATNLPVAADTSDFVSEPARFVVLTGENDQVSRLLQDNQPFRVRLWLSDNADLAKQQFMYSATIQARNLTDNNQTAHRESGYVEFGDQAVLNINNVLLASGAYRLKAIVNLQPSGKEKLTNAGLNFQVEGGMLQVC
ncbi:MAG: hypothetical protein SF097_00315 [Acidobacteriota bacterium]|nr:hypothetical protein [Acidobacteriota bacterium]